MAKITVTLDDALKILKNSLNTESTYKYSQIKKTLIESFTGINDNQVAGLITRMKKEGYLETNKIPGKTSDYKLRTISIRQNSNIRSTVNSEYKKFLEKLNSLKLDVSNSDDFKYLQDKINKTKEIFEDSEN